MAETISFSSGSFSTGTIDGPGSNDVVVTKQGDGFVLSTENSTPIVNLGIQGDNEAENLSILSDTSVAVKGFTANLAGGDDSLFIGGKTKGNSVINLGKGSDSIESTGTFKNSELLAKRGNDQASFEAETKFVAIDARIDMGNGNDDLVFGGSVKDIDVKLGAGSDNVEFGGKINGAKLDLGTDGDVDKIRLSADADIKGFVITGADDNDLLFIGSTQYNYDSNNNLWVNSSDSNDTRNFS